MKNTILFTLMILLVSAMAAAMVVENTEANANFNTALPINVVVWADNGNLTNAQATIVENHAAVTVGGTSTQSLGTIAQYDNAIASWTLTGTAAGSYPINVSVTSAEENKTHSFTLVVAEAETEAVLTLDIEAPTSVTINEEFTINATAENIGTATESNVTITITLPSGATTDYVATRFNLEAGKNKTKQIAINQSQEGLKSYKIKAEGETVFVEQTIDIISSAEPVNVTIPTCDAAWQCTEWSSCSDGTQTRTCTCACGTGCTGDDSETQTCSTGGSSRRRSRGSSSGGSDIGGTGVIQGLTFQDGKTTAAIREGGELQFTFQGTVYSIVANDITSEEVNLTIKNHKVSTRVIAENESKDFNLNYDGITDLRVKVENINTNMWAFLRLEFLPQNITVTPEPQIEPTLEPQTEPQARPRFDTSGYTLVNLDHSKIGKIILAIAVIVLLAVLVIAGILKGWFVDGYNWCKKKCTKKPVRGKAAKTKKEIDSLNEKIKELKKSLKK